MKKHKCLYVVGIGPGAYEEMTIRAVKILEQCEVIIGYTVYVDLVMEHFPGKEFITTPMKQESKRCEIALQEANQGRQCAIICSGDCGIYGMAGLVLELASAYPEVEVQLVPGITAASAGAAVLGAPLGHDFAVISLSDLLTSWELIEKRLKSASASDLAMAIYNPSSKKRSDYLQKACRIILEHQSEDTVCGIVRNITREGQEMSLMTLRELQDLQVDMFTTVFIGNSQTKIIDGKMVTPRGYLNV